VAPGTRLRLHAFEPRSAANGPGLRAVLWVQGCTLGCAGCFNPETHPRGGDDVSVAELFGRILALGEAIKGVTVSGGEPLQQRRAILTLLARVRAETSLSTIVFTGYAWPELASMPDLAALRHCVDVLIAGRYDATRRVARGLLGSSNKTVHLFSDRYTLDDLDTVPDAELIIRPDGGLVISGINPPRLAGLAPGDSGR
jgi:anaerobic ribonucleoside-triphosphate reductase activating protein